MIILDDSKSLSVLASDTSNGLGQIGCINPLVTENLNGSYELEFDIAISEKYFPLLKVGGLLKCRNNTSDQMFRIYFISKAINGVVNVKAQHITYDLSGVVVKPFTATGAVSAKNGMLSNVIGTTPFTMTTDITNTTSVFTLDIPRSFRECLGGYEGSLLDVFRGEYEWDNLSVNMLAHRGADNGVRIAYGKNLTDFTQEENNENVFDAVYGYALVDEVFYAPSGIYNKTGASQPKVKVVDFSSKYDSGNVPTPSDLYNDAQTYATNNDIEVPSVNIKISFVPLWQTEEYKGILPLERVSLGDTVHVFFEKLNVEATARVIKTVWNVNLDRYEEIELGSAKANLNTVINESVDSAVSEAMGDIDTGYLEGEMLSMSKLIANGMGLHITKDSIGRIFLHNNEDLAQSQFQYQITSQGFMLSEDYGQTWNSGWDISGNAVVNSLATITLKFLEGYGMFMRFGDINSNYIDVAPYTDGVSFDGSGSIRMQPQGSYLIRNINSSNRTFNSLYMTYSSTESEYNLSNYRYNYSRLANDVRLSSANSYNSLYLRNFNKNIAEETLSNTLQLLSDSTQNKVYVSNKEFSSATEANALTLSASDSVGNRASIENRRSSDGVVINAVELFANSSTTWAILKNGRVNISGSTYTDANRVTLQTDSSGNNTMTLWNNKYNQDACANKIVMDGKLNTMTIFSDSDIFLQSNGAIRMSSSSRQDIVITSDDSLKLNYTKLYFNGILRNLQFGSDGYVRWSGS